MGSALCFPVEAMVFYTLIQSAMHILDGRRPSSQSIRRYGKLIDIYGDDIIVPVEYTDFVVKYLESFALKVNVNKSFKASAFRESCGEDFFNGIPVKPVYAREVPHDDSRHWNASTIMSWNATADLFYMKGQWLVAQHIRDMLRRVVKRTIPRSRKPGSGLFHLSFLFDTHCHYDSKLHNWKQKRIIFDPTKKKDKIDGDEIACLNKWGISTRVRSESYSYRTSSKRKPYWVYASAGSSAVLTNSTSLGRDVPRSDATLLERGISPVQPGMQNDGDSPCSLCNLEELSEIRSSSSTDEGHPPSSACVKFAEVWWPDPLSHLTDDATELDFLSSVKRGGFKSKHRWVSLAG